MKIIVAIDGTKTSEVALYSLLGMQWDAGTEFKLVIVLKSEESAFPFFRKGGSQKSSELIEAACNALEFMTVEVQKELPDCKISFEVKEGDAKSQISEIAKQWNADLVVMGSRNNKGLDLMLLGSVSQGVLLQSPCPVLIVKSDDRVEDTRNQGFKKVLVAADNSPYAQAALAWLKTMKWTKDTQFKLITVVSPLVESFESLQDAASASTLSIEHNQTIDLAASELKIMARTLGEHVGADNVSTEVAEGDPRECILQTASSMQADLIVMGSHGRTGLTKLLIGSVSQALAVHANCSVAIVRGLTASGKGGMQISGRFEVVDKEQLRRPAKKE